ncbi:pyridoxamine 5'-phosphate oxidase [Alphaproteobacteria bacterium]|nr:pyridoxamine 5'-phosphate oxidase [Alphaproteobacteria bacterium]
MAEETFLLDFDHPPADPFPLFNRWFGDAEAHEINDPNAMSLATVDEAGLPNVRVVLLKGHDTRGFVFYTNLESQKGQEIEAHAQAALNFHWKSLRRQIRLRGHLEAVSDQEADDYYHSRPRQSQLGAWASEQSRPVENRVALEHAFEEIENKYKNEEIIPRPPHWSGRRLVPSMIEFWEDGAHRLHNRVRYQRDGSAWTVQRLYP